MLMFIWFCVVAQAFMPGGQQLASLSTKAIEAQMRVEAPEAPAVDKLVTRYAPRAIGMAR